MDAIVNRWGQLPRWQQSLTWIVGILTVLMGLVWAAIWAWTAFQSWWAGAGGGAQFVVISLVAGTVIGGIAKACGASWGWAVALAVGLPFVVGLGVLWGALRLVGASSRTFD